MREYFLKRLSFFNATCAAAKGSLDWAGRAILRSWPRSRSATIFHLATQRGFRYMPHLTPKCNRAVLFLWAHPHQNTAWREWASTRDQGEYSCTRHELPVSLCC